MQDFDWNDLKYVLALQRCGKLIAAGRALGVSETTVARRIRSLETALRVQLFVRTATGTYDPTDDGQTVLDRAEAIERQSAAVAEELGNDAQGVTGTVRVSSVPVIVNRFLVDGLAELKRSHPGLILELIPGSGNLDLAKREADVALRFARPIHGGLKTRAQKLGELEFAVFVPANAAPEEASRLDWIGYDDAHAGLPQARWLDAVIRRSPTDRAGLRVADIETALEATAAGAGRTVLPISIAGRDRRLRRVNVSAVPALPVREVWMLSHADQAARRSVDAVKAWIVKLPWSDDAQG